MGFFVAANVVGATVTLHLIYPVAVVLGAATNLLLHTASCWHECLWCVELTYW